VPKELSGNVMQTKECMILPIYFLSIRQGVLDDGEEIAVKYLHNSEQTDKDFNREFDNIRKLNHPNIVRLVAYSFETQHQPRDFKGQLMFGECIRRALCFEFMSNGSLEGYLSGMPLLD
jgi:serine/threonine protein kinase